MRVMIGGGGEEKGDQQDSHPSLPPLQQASEAASGQSGAGVSAPSQQTIPSGISLPSAESRNSNLNAQARPASPRRSASAEAERDTTIGKQRASASETRPEILRAESPSDDVNLDENVRAGNVRPEGNVTGQCLRPAAGEGRPRATRRGPASAGAAARESSPTGATIGLSARDARQQAVATLRAEQEIERTFEAELNAKGWQLRRQEGDGNCLFRAISQQIYGDPGMHGDIRRQCLDFMRKERDHYSHFVSEAFESYVSRKEQDGVHGNNPEIQAASELFNRPIEVYVPERGTVPINIFHGGYRSGNAPIRVSYHGGSHYNAVIDPEEASVGQGLGVPGLSKEAAEKESLKRALAESCSSAHQVFPGAPPAFYKGGRGSFDGACVESDLRATEDELEQAAIKASLADFRGKTAAGEGGGGGGGGGGGAFDSASAGFLASAASRSDASFSVGRWSARGGLAHGRQAARGASSRAAAGRGERRAGASAAWAGADSSRNAGLGRGGASGTSPRKRRRPGSPNSPVDESARKGSPNSGDSSSAVREMVWSYGFPLARVLRAHDLVGDSVEDMLVLLTSDAFQPPDNDGAGSGAAAAAASSLGGSGST